ncbi:hypothetical protein ACHAXR_009080 [Thalassiosira sp. AJA248-18]
MPQKPEPVKKKEEIKNIVKVVSQKEKFDLLLFGPTCGKCPHCGGGNITDTTVNAHVKTIRTLCTPRFVQGMGMKCETCTDKKGWQTFESTYVATLPPNYRAMLNAQVVGASDGICMDLVVQMRLGSTASALEKTSRANLLRWRNDVVKSDYDRRVEQTRLSYGEYHGLVVELTVPPLNDLWVAKSSSITNAFLRDYINHKEHLLREMATLKSDFALAADHQYKVVRKVQGKKATQSFSIVGDGGVVLGYYVVPDTNMKWVHEAFVEIVHRHKAILDAESRMCIQQGELPPIIYVDTNCCGSNGRDDANKWLYGMLKKLDAFHLTDRVAKQINSEHPRKGELMSQLSKCIFTTSQEDAKALEEAREEGGVSDLTKNQKKADRSKYVRRVIQFPKKIVAKILLLFKKEIAIDRQAILQHQRDGDPCVDISPAHPAYPLITKKVSQCAIRQCTHILNGCVHDEEAVNLSVGPSDYRNTGIFLNTNRSTRGTNKVESLHSMLDKSFYPVSNNIRELLFDARAHWAITNYNRIRLKNMGRPTLEPGVAPSEDDSIPLLVESTTLKFGFQYFNYVENKMEDEIDDAVLEALDADTHDTVDILDEPEMEYVDADDDTDVATVQTSLGDYTPDINLDIPDSVDAEALKRIGEEMDTEAVCNIASIPTVPAPLGDMDLGFGDALAECNEMSDLMGQAAGMDTQALFGDIDLLSQNNANERRNVATRRARSQQQQGNDVGPGYNNEMETKWIELWGDGPNPLDGVAFRTWYYDKKKLYRIWMLRTLLEAEQNNLPAPPLHNITYDATKKWADKMKGLSNIALTTGALNAITGVLVQQFDSIMNASTEAENVGPFENDGGLGVAVDQSTLQLNVTSTASENQFRPPTSDAVKTMMPTKKRKAAIALKQVDLELQERQARARLLMEVHQIAADSKEGGKRRCTVCNKYFVFEFGDVPHMKKRKFCPLADDHSIYHGHKESERLKQNERMKRKRAEQRHNKI